jgi:DNA repair exonuclease SbcCD ATPase subunit
MATREETLEEMEERAEMLKRELAAAEASIRSFHPSHPNSNETHVEHVENEIKEIRSKLPKAKKKRTHKLPVHLRHRKKKVQEGPPVHDSPNTVGEIRNLERRCEDMMKGESVQMVWALVFKMPEQEAKDVSAVLSVLPAPPAAARPPRTRCSCGKTSTPRL